MPKKPGLPSKVNIKGKEFSARCEITTESGEVLLVRKCTIVIDPKYRIMAHLEIPVNELNLENVSMKKEIDA